MQQSVISLKKLLLYIIISSYITQLEYNAVSMCTLEHCYQMMKQTEKRQVLLVFVHTYHGDKLSNKTKDNHHMGGEKLKTIE